MTRGVDPFAWSRADADDLRSLHAVYRHFVAEPFFLEISGPDPEMTTEAFSAWCQDDAAMWVARVQGAIAGFIWYSYIQPEIGVANIDWCILAGHPPAGSAASRSLSQAILASWRELCLRKVHLLCLKRQRRRSALARTLGFIDEGVLHEHFHDRGRLQDLTCLGRLDAGA